jgi:hypothetical protein
MKAFFTSRGNMVVANIDIEKNRNTYYNKVTEKRFLEEDEFKWRALKM